MPRMMASESVLIESFRRAIDRARTRGRGVVVGPGDDAAVLRVPGGEDVVVTTDALVEGRHFQRRWFNGRELGWRLAAVNASDLAAVGATPRYALVSLVVPVSVGAAYVFGIERGVIAHLARLGAVVVGGNVSSTDGPLVCDLTLVGTCARGRALRRFARAADTIVVAGELGAAAAGVRLLREGTAKGKLVAAYRRPVPRLDVARALAGDRRVHGAIDVSDGFSTDVIHVCRASGLGCDVEPRRLPTSLSTRAFVCDRKLDLDDWALHAGEDYALILSVAARSARDVCRRIEAAGVRATVVGRFTTARGVYRLIDEHGRASRFAPGGWDHFKQ